MPSAASAEGPLDTLAAVTHRDPYPYYRELIAREPLRRDDGLGFWVAVRAETVRAVLTSDLCRVRPESEPVPRPLLGSPAGEIFGQLVRMTDGSSQMSTKLTVAGHLASMNPALIAHHGRASARRLGEMLAPERHPERLAEFAFGLPAYVIGSLLGVAPDRLPELARWTGSFVRCLSPAATAEQIEEGKEAAGRLAETFQALLGRPGLDAVVANRIGYLSQSYEATAGLIGNTLVALGRHPDVRIRFEAERGGLMAVIREVLRHDTPVQNTRRFLARAGTIAGQSLAAGDAVLVVLAAANHDPAANPDPARFDPARRERVAFTFGLGAHACPGETIATLIAQAGVEHLLASGVEPGRLIERVTYRPSANTRIPLFGGRT